MKIKRALFFSAILIITTVFSGCSIDDDKTVVTMENGEKYSFYETTSEDTRYVQGIDVTKASLSEISALKGDDTCEYDAVGVINTAEQAARCGITVLNNTYSEWTNSENTLVVYFNSNANVWCVHGQAVDRNHPQEIGEVIFNSENGEILYINLSPCQKN